MTHLLLLLMVTVWNGSEELSTLALALMSLVSPALLILLVIQVDLGRGARSYRLPIDNLQQRRALDRGEDFGRLAICARDYSRGSDCVRHQL